MELQQVFHMNRGDGETSYAKNSSIQNKIISTAKAITKEAILDYYCSGFPETLTIADLGCSSGPNTLLVVSNMVDAIEERCLKLKRPPPEFQLFLNDLPGNDFNTVFRSLARFYEGRVLNKGTDQLAPCFVAGVPGSFYGRLFPCKSLHFVHSSSSLHWLSQVPLELQRGENMRLNRGKIYISKGSPPSVLNAYFMQFQSDFSLFLKLRSEEIMVGGRMVLVLVGRSNVDPTAMEKCGNWDMLARVLMDMVLEGLLKEDKVDSFNAPYYSPSSEEVQDEIQREGSFSLKSLQIFEVDTDLTRDYNCNINDKSKEKNFTIDNLTKGQHIANTYRAVLESMLVSHFGEDIIDDLFQRYSKVLDEELVGEKTKITNLVISLVRNS